MDRNDLFVFTDITDDDIDAMVEEFRTHKDDDSSTRPVIDPFDEEIDAIAAQARAEAASPKIPPIDAPDDDVAVAPPAKERRAKKQRRAKPKAGETPVPPANEPAADKPSAKEPVSAKKRNGFMRFLGGIVPHVGDGAFDIIRKCVMLLGIVVFVGAATYLVDDLVIIPVQNDILTQSLQGMYNPDGEVALTPEEENYTYPDGMDPAFKKLYYQNNDVRGWIRYFSSDNTTLTIDLPIMHSGDNDKYLHHDFYGNYNKNGTLFYDYRNVIAKDTTVKNTIIYGHNMKSGQMFAGINRFNLGVSYARSAPTFTMNTLYEKGEYKVFAVMALNTEPDEGTPFNYLRTEFSDNVDFAGFLSEILARSLYVYGDVDVNPDDEIVMLSTCGEEYMMHYTNSRTVVVARKVREGEDPSVDPSTITVNEDVIMPFGWYVNQSLPAHPYYTDPNYVIQPIDGIMDYIATSTADPNASGTTTSFTLHSQDGTFGLISSRTTTTVATKPTTELTPQVLTVTNGRATYSVGESFDAAGTTLSLSYSNGFVGTLTAAQCDVIGFDSSAPGTCVVTFRYGAVSTTMTVTIVGPSGDADTSGTLPPPTTSTTVKPSTAATTEPTTTPTEPSTEPPAEPTEAPVDEPIDEQQPADTPAE